MRHARYVAVLAVPVPVMMGLLWTWGAGSARVDGAG